MVMNLDVYSDNFRPRLTQIDVHIRNGNQSIYLMHSLTVLWGKWTLKFINLYKCTYSNKEFRLRQGYKGFRKLNHFITQESYPETFQSTYEESWSDFSIRIPAKADWGDSRTALTTH